MTTTLSAISEILETAGLAEVAYRRGDLEGGFGELWDITLPNEEATIRLFDNDGRIEIIVLTGGRAQLIAGEMTFSHAMAAPTYVAAMLDQIVADYS